MIKSCMPVCLLLIIFSSNVFSQSTDNLTSFNYLIDSVVMQINKYLPPTERIQVIPKMPEDYFVFQGRIINKFKTSGREIVSNEQNSGYRVNIILDEARVKYSEIFKEKLFGDFRVKRIISLTGNYNISKDGSIIDSEEINLQNIDTVNYDEIKNLENNSLPYTKGVIPSEPVFSSLLEPLIAVSAAALTVILFFTVRSK